MIISLKIESMQTIKYCLSCLFFVLASTVHQDAMAQSPGSAKTDMQTLLQNKQYLFTAQYAQPLSGRQINLTSTYTFKITGDSLVCHLPYFGQAYIVENYPGGGGLDFVSHHFEYEVSPAKHSRYVVSIRITDRSDVSRIFLNVSKNGYASLQITPVNHQAISFYGEVTELKKRM